VIEVVEGLGTILMRIDEQLERVLSMLEEDE
jgi:hypothetical protein